MITAQRLKFFLLTVSVVCGTTAGADSKITFESNWNRPI